MMTRLLAHWKMLRMNRAKAKARQVRSLESEFERLRAALFGSD